jgi:hypothetical protein
VSSHRCAHHEKQITMAFFKEAPIKGLTRDRDNAKANVDRLSLKLHDAEANVIATTSLAQRAALDGDDGGLDAAEAAERAALHRHGTLAAACGEAGKLLALLESQIAETLDKKTRAATALATNALADELVEVAAGYHASTSALAEVATRALAVTMEANGLAVFTASSLIEVAAAIPVVAEVLRQHARAVTNNLAPAAMPIAPEPPAKPVAAAPKAPTVRVFSTKPIKWLDEDGKQRSGGKCVDLDLPVATAERALATGACVKLDHPSRAGNIGRWPGHYSLSVCFDLDADAAAPQHDPIKHSAFVETIGAPRLMRVGGTS